MSTTQQIASPDARAAPRAADTGLLHHMSQIYGLMGFALTISAGAALLVAHDPRLNAALFTADGMTILGWIVLLAPIALVVTISAGVERIAPPAARAMFVLYALLVGLSLGSLGYAFTGASIGGTLIATGLAFALLALWGYTARRDLSAMGVFFGIGLFGIVLMMLINLWVRSERFDLYLAAAAIVTFAALTAFDVQRLKRLYLEGDNRSAVIGALTLYLDFVNMFLAVLRFTGKRR